MTDILINGIVGLVLLCATLIIAIAFHWNFWLHLGFNGLIVAGQMDKTYSKLYRRLRP